LLRSPKKENFYFLYLYLYNYQRFSTFLLKLQHNIKDKKNNREVALKKMISAIEEEGIPSTAIREISLLREIDHPNVIKLLNIVID